LEENRAITAKNNREYVDFMIEVLRLLR
jgi:hypothetical protein